MPRAQVPVTAATRPGDDRGSARGELNWLLEHLITTVDRVRQAVILSPDGLTMGNFARAEPGGGRPPGRPGGRRAEPGPGAGQRFAGGEVRQIIIEMDAALLFITAAVGGTCLAVLADPEADAGLIAYEMAMLVKRVGQHMVANPRSPAPHASSW